MATDAEWVERVAEAADRAAERLRQLDPFQYRDMIEDLETIRDRIAGNEPDQDVDGR